MIVVPGPFCDITHTVKLSPSLAVSPPVQHCSNGFGASFWRSVAPRWKDTSELFFSACCMSPSFGWWGHFFSFIELIQHPKDCSFFFFLFSSPPSSVRTASHRCLSSICGKRQERVETFFFLFWLICEKGAGGIGLTQRGWEGKRKKMSFWHWNLCRLWILQVIRLHIWVELHQTQESNNNNNINKTTII